ncbi:MAG: hypothetical protein M0Z34_10965 [Nitrospiraceae bacterium]|nr:hypothetical protein [Nitrospiraceae bacterium]
MNGYGDPDVAGRDGREFDPREASELLERATEQARRVSDIPDPVLTLIASAVVLVAYGAI